MTIQKEKGLIAWFAYNNVAANLLMCFIIIAGLLSVSSIQRQLFPHIDINWVTIDVVYPGASPSEVESAITVKIEKAISDISGIKRVISSSSRASARLQIEVDNQFDINSTIDDIKNQIDGISNLPPNAEEAIVQKLEQKHDVLWVSLYGDMSAKDIKNIGIDIHQEILNLPGINVTSLESGLDFEISIDVSKDKLREFNISIDDVARAVNSFSNNSPAGQIRTDSGLISLRTENQAYTASDFKNIPLIASNDGTEILLSDVATIQDDFEEGIQYAKYNGKNAVLIYVGAAKNQSITDVSKIVNQYVDNKSENLPDTLKMESWVDTTYYLQGRLNMMLENMFLGCLLVFLMLSLFLHFRLAFWVMLGLPVAFLGTMIMLPMSWVNVTINVTSLFGFILILGIVVDDAIIIGESVYGEIESKGPGINNVIRGTKRVAMPASIGVLTTAIAFLPLVFTDSLFAALSQSIGFVVIFCLIFSLVESKLILPAHLSKLKIHQSNDNFYHRLRQRIDSTIKSFTSHQFNHFVKTVLYFRYSVILLFMGIFAIAVALLQYGILEFTGSPKVSHDFPEIKTTMNQGSSEKSTLDALLYIENKLQQVDNNIEREHGHSMIESTYTVLSSRTSGKITAKLVDPNKRAIDTFQLSEKIREALPTIAGVRSIIIEDDLFGSSSDNNSDISFKFSGENIDQLLLAGDELKAALTTFDGVGNISNSNQGATQEILISLNAFGHSLGLTTAEVARQMNNSLYGLEAQRILRNGEEVKVMVRYPKNQRESITALSDVLIRLDDGSELLLGQVATTEKVKGLNTIRREDGKRTLTISASVNNNITTPQKIVGEINKTTIPKLVEKYPGLKSEIGGKIKNDAKEIERLLYQFLLAILAIYALMAVTLRSYSQPLIIMSVIPFGMIGAMIGHMILGLQLSALSIFGIIATAGVVVNDSLIIVAFINEATSKGMNIERAALESSCKRFRAITLTSITTFIGLMPIIFESSLQAKLIIPMAVSLAFGVLFATVITLLLVPCLYLAGQDINKLFKRLLGYSQNTGEASV